MTAVVETKRGCLHEAHAKRHLHAHSFSRQSLGPSEQTPFLTTRTCLHVSECKRFALSPEIFRTVPLVHVLDILLTSQQGVHSKQVLPVRHTRRLARRMLFLKRGRFLPTPRIAAHTTNAPTSEGEAKGNARDHTRLHCARIPSLQNVKARRLLLLLPPPFNSDLAKGSRCVRAQEDVLSYVNRWVAAAQTS